MNRRSTTTNPIQTAVSHPSPTAAGFELDAIEAQLPRPTADLTPIDLLPESADREALRRMRSRAPSADPIARLEGDVPPTKIPRHVAVIMDGNGRWATERGKPRTAGHNAGMLSLEHTVREAKYLGIEYLTVYSFSTENWSRPQPEVDALMALYVLYMTEMRPRFIEHGVRVHQIGRRDRLSEDALRAMRDTLDATAACTEINLVLAVDYSSRDELTRAAAALAADAAAGRLNTDAICDADIQARLDTNGLPDPDLLIRTGGEMRLSNYLLWQLSYAEIHLTPRHWPEFRAPDLHAAVRDYASRDRRFGNIGSTSNE